MLLTLGACHFDGTITYQTKVFERVELDVRQGPSGERSSS